MSEKIRLKRNLQGIVVSNKMDKTAVVLMDRKVPHPKYAKYITRRTKVFAHDEKNICKIGDKVLIQETRPLSKHKSWMLLEVIEKASHVGESS